jgi:hypothetical protein
MTGRYQRRPQPVALVDRRRRLFCAVLACLPGVALGQARAESFAVALDYAAVAGCPDVGLFKELTKAELGHDPFRPEAPDRVLVRLTRSGPAIDGSIEWRDSSGNRIGEQVFPLASTDCDSVASATAFALALQIQLLEKRRASSVPGGSRGKTVGAAAPKADRSASPATNRAGSLQAAEPSSNLAASPPSAPSSPTTDPEPGPPEPEPLPAAKLPAAPSVPPHPTRLVVGLGPSLGVGMASNPVLLGRVFAGLEWRSLAVELAAEAGLPTTTRRADGAGFRQQRLVASAAACMTLPRWRTCLLGNLGEVRLGGEIDRPASATAVVAELGARLGVVQPFGERVFVGAHADGLAVLNRCTARLDQVAVWTAPRFAAAFGVDVGVRFR